MEEVRVDAASGDAHPRCSLSGLPTSNRANCAACPSARERRLQRAGAERAAGQPLVRIGVFRAQLSRAASGRLSLRESPLHPVAHARAETPKTSTSSAALIFLLQTVLRTLGTKAVFLWPGL